MHRVLVVCGAGASSTFLAHRLRSAARGRGVDITVAASSTEGIEQRLFEVDVLLVGPHLASRFEELSQLARSAGSAIALLPDTVFGSGGEDAALDLVMHEGADRSPTT